MKCSVIKKKLVEILIFAIVMLTSTSRYFELNTFAENSEIIVNNENVFGGVQLKIVV
ncbi:hypothetical protein SAMN06296386_101376 [Lachnospiraceae bacterium]|nr:hypothetical protein SAMN06296386_101376 [Lachnospiraceae bacterium]